MKKIKILPLMILLLIGIMSSCKKDVEDRIPGDWDMVMTSMWDTESYVYSGNMSFDEDGTGLMTLDGTAFKLSWTATEETVTIKFDQYDVIAGQALVLDVIVNEKKEQQWKFEETLADSEESYVWSVEIKLTR